MNCIEEYRDLDYISILLCDYCYECEDEDFNIQDKILSLDRINVVEYDINDILQECITKIVELKQYIPNVLLEDIFRYYKDKGKISSEEYIGFLDNI